MGGAIIEKSGAASFRYGGRHVQELGGGFLRNQQRTDQIINRTVSAISLHSPALVCSMLRANRTDVAVAAKLAGHKTPSHPPILHVFAP